MKSDISDLYKIITARFNLKIEKKTMNNSKSINREQYSKNSTKNKNCYKNREP